LLGDPGRIRQVIVNLVGNAVKFTNEGEVYINVWPERTEDDRLGVHFMVQDTGVGIPEDKIDCIFEAFRQSDSSTTRRFGGTGLGLAISAQLVELMCGRIWVESQLGKGSRFHFVLPLEAERSTTDPEPPAVHGGINVLLFSENEHSREAILEILEAQGFHVDATDRADEVVRKACPKADAERTAEVVLVDLHVASPAGWELVQRLVKDAAPNGLPIVLLTPAGQTDVVEQCVEIGVEFSVAKPAKSAEIIEAILEALVPKHKILRADEGPAGGRGSQSLSILVADDSPINQEVALGILELKGHYAQVVSDGREAVEAFKTRQFDAILMDLEMPVMDGLAATTEIRRLEAESDRRRVPIIALSAHAVNEVRQRCFDADMDGYLPKPIRPEQLFDALENLARRTTETDLCKPV
jgi:CheY-like chemotaxis protein